MELPKNPTRKLKQPISVPFIWESKPGIPRIDWEPVRPSRPPPPPPHHPPIKLIASVPFEWEEKPGKPLRSFPQPTTEQIIKFENHLGDKNESKGDREMSFGSFNFQCVDSDENNSGIENESEMVSESESETLTFHTDESLPYLLANRLMPAVTIASAVPVLETLPDYESDSSTSSYATGTTSLVGAPFLEKLFPLLPAVRCPEEKEHSSTDHKMELQRKDLVCESSFSARIKKPTTLGELIMMSRRRSFIRKPVPVRRHNFMKWQGSMKEGAAGCFMFGINNKIEELQRKMKNQLQLKLI